MESAEARYFCLPCVPTYKHIFHKTEGDLVPPSSLMSLKVSRLNFQVLYFKQNLLLFTFWHFFCSCYIYSLCTELYFKLLNGISLGNRAGGMIHAELTDKQSISLLRKGILYSKFRSFVLPYSKQKFVQEHSINWYIIYRIHGDNLACMCMSEGLSLVNKVNFTCLDLSKWSLKKK